MSELSELFQRYEGIGIRDVELEGEISRELARKNLATFLVSSETWYAEEFCRKINEPYEGTTFRLMPQKYVYNGIFGAGALNYPDKPKMKYNSFQATYFMFYTGDEMYSVIIELLIRNDQVQLCVRRMEGSESKRFPFMSRSELLAITPYLSRIFKKNPITIDHSLSRL